MAELLRYEISTDEMVPITKEWVRDAEALFSQLGAARRAARAVIEIRDGLLNAPPPELQAFLDAWKPEFIQNINKFIEERDHALEVRQASSNDGGRRPQSSICQEGGDSDSRGQGVQQGGPGQVREAAKEIAVAYAVTVDGWISIPARAIRNSESPHIVWMLKATWESLATHADIRGLFFIPCETAPDARQLRLLVNSQELADAR